MHCVDLVESFQTHIYLQNFVSIQPRTSLVKFARSPRTVCPCKPFACPLEEHHPPAARRWTRPRSTPSGPRRASRTGSPARMAASGSSDLEIGKLSNISQNVANFDILTHFDILIFSTFFSDGLPYARRLLSSQVPPSPYFGEKEKRSAFRSTLREKSIS